MPSVLRRLSAALAGLLLLIGLLAAPPAAARPALGLGLAGVADWGTQHPFLDLMKTGRPWIGHRPGQWGGWSHGDLARGGYLDANGWPTAIPRDLEAVETLILTSQPAAASALAGRYRVSYRGTGRIEMRHNATNVREAPGEIWFDYAPGPGLVGIAILATDPDDPVRDITVLHERDIARHDRGEIFNPRWLDRIRGVQAVRFMDWMETNDSGISGWAMRPKPGDYTYARVGVPVEIMVALANELGADPWFNMPHMADDDYMRRFAEYVRDTLRPGLRAHVEYSNEVWNWQFGQADWALEQGQERWGRDVGDAWVQFYGMRAAQMAQIWGAVFGASADERLVRVIATQTGYRGLEEPILTAPRWVAEDPARNQPPYRHFDAYAVTGYFSGNLGSDDKAALVRRWLAESRAAASGARRFDLAVERAAAELRDGALSGDDGSTLAQLLDEYLPYHAEVARRHGLALVAYEGGTHVVGLGSQVDDEEMTAFFAHLNYTPQMGALYDRLLDGWAAAGGGLFMAFVDVAAPSKWGSWGALRHLQDDNPRWDALMRAARGWR